MLHKARETFLAGPLTHRDCLRCRKKFWSAGFWNRLCDRCNAANAADSNRHELRTFPCGRRVNRMGVKD